MMAMLIMLIKRVRSVVVIGCMMAMLIMLIKRVRSVLVIGCMLVIKFPAW